MAGQRVIVIGAGVAGLAAAWSATVAGASVVVVGEADGASRFMSGALDLESWETDAVAPTRVDQEVVALCDLLGIWRVAEQRVRLATPWGAIRAARGRDRALLDLSALRSARIAVVRADRPEWNAELLASAWRSAPWSTSGDVRFDAVSVDLFERDEERFMTDAELAAAFDDPTRVDRFAKRLRDRIEGFDAVLTGPWLGVDTDAAQALSDAVRRPVGESLSTLASSAGWRFARARDRVLSACGIERRRELVRELVHGDGGVTVRCEGAAIELVGDVAVIACGGLAGGGIAYDPSEADLAPELPNAPRSPFALSFRSPAVVVVDGLRSSVPGSMFGMDLERFAWPSIPQQTCPLETVSLAHRNQVCLDIDGNPLPRMLVAGQAASRKPMGVLGAISSGLRAGHAASRKSK